MPNEKDASMRKPISEITFIFGIVFLVMADQRRADVPYNLSCDVSGLLSGATHRTLRVEYGEWHAVPFGHLNPQMRLIQQANYPLTVEVFTPDDIVAVLPMMLNDAARRRGRMRYAVDRNCCAIRIEYRQEGPPLIGDGPLAYAGGLWS